MQTRRVEVNVAVATVQAMVLLAVADLFGPLYRECFEDSPTAPNFKSASTKTSCIINEAVAPHYKNGLVMKMKENPFTLVTDGSNDTGIPLTAKLPVSMSSCSCHTEIKHMQYMHAQLVMYMLCIVAGLEKMNPLTVRVFDITKVVHRFLDMCTTSGRSCGTADVISKKNQWCPKRE